jgi:hypothetical protein
MSALSSLVSPQLRSHDQALKLRLVAITAGCPATMLENAPVGFLNLFPEHLVERKLGLFAETLVPAGGFKALAGHTGVKEASPPKRTLTSSSPPWGISRTRMTCWPCS